jgi:hypothetical protein
MLGAYWSFPRKKDIFHDRVPPGSHCLAMLGRMAEARGVLDWMAIIAFATYFYVASWLDSWCNADASESGVAQETIQNRGSKVMEEQEARQILGALRKLLGRRYWRLVFICMFIHLHLLGICLETYFFY